MKKNKQIETNKFILLDGTSSTGKSTIGKYFSSNNFLHYEFDKYRNDKRIDKNNLVKNIKNKYGELRKIMVDEPVKYMVDDAIASNQNVLFDHISQKEIVKYMKSKKISKKLYIINIFANLDDLARNIEMRRKEGDARGTFVFNQFSDRYIKCANNDANKIETVNREKFRKLLLKYFKYEFKSEDSLNDFSNKIFNKMNIKDDKDHFIKLRDEYICDYLLITTNKTKDDIFDELSKANIL
jgi:adenylate kinase family enzyme